MFEHTDKPRLFALPPGLDFPNAVVQGVLERATGIRPEALAQVEIYVNTQRMQRRMRSLFADGGARLLPQIRVLGEIGQDLATKDLPPAIPPLRRRLELAQLVARLIEAEPDLAPRSSIFPLADSLADLMDEMQGEGVSPETLRNLDVDDQSGHWQRALSFVSLVEQFLGDAAKTNPDKEGRQRQVIERLVTRWADTPPTHPVIIAGSTGSRGATAHLMRAVARLPQGAVILPGFDWDMPNTAWAQLEDALSAEDHPQYRFAALTRDLGLTPEDIQLWAATSAPNPARNRLLSLALRPAPVTDQWQIEGPVFEGVQNATQGVTLVEAKSPRQEALAIALILRDAAERREPIALITPDRNLTRQVTAALDRWGIEPDDSAGRPLALSAPGRLFRHVGDLFLRELTSDHLLAILKHPLTHSGSARGDHLRWTRDLELEVLRRGLPYPTPEALNQWALKREGDEALQTWVSWINETLFQPNFSETKDLETWVDQHVTLTEIVARGPENSDQSELWNKPAGREALRKITELQNEAPFGGEMSAQDYMSLFSAILNQGEVRDPNTPHKGIMFWGTLEARVQGTETVILAGLNEGSWPEAPKPDPWMNRKMRQQAGLLLPERRIGLSAHDFQQAAAAKRVILTRAARNDESETVPSRWINRLVNLLGGMSSDGSEALGAMRQRGETWLSWAEQLEAISVSVPAENRPSPRPPVTSRPTRLSVTRISKLIRDPYAIYAEQVLKLRPLRPLHQPPDAPLRGTVLHQVLEDFVTQRPDEETSDAAKARLLEVADDVLNREAPWPATRALWKAKLERVADWFIDEEAKRRDYSRTIATEVRGQLKLDDLGFTLTGTADRIDQDHDGRLWIYDYKTGSPPSEKAQRHFDKQLLLEAVIAKAGGFEKLPDSDVGHVAYIGLGAQPVCINIPLSPPEIDQIKDELSDLISAYHRPEQGYLSRRAVQEQRFEGDYDHLARFGEWDDSQPGNDVEVGQ
ncbi:double-strand break repair protein AddB [Aliiroseovarius sp. KMU-50]|uniref:Double-strand break repair protein AddB n=2 Tax=Aliiroseovarius salicola TaxID=3009082 RepID=A0ABT4VXE2_9RHOB|nr:double-strand break repair protein AddB [Aliiroseovarius sp. KMU-50]MDA5092941.1 double-strand break repair protein AddB [Aliiroseovarius sp. KMU-50]